MQGLNWFQSFPYCQGREADTHLNTSAQCSLFQNWESIRSRPCCKGNIRSTRFDLCTGKSRELWRGFSICHCDRAACHLKSRAHWKQSTPLWKVTLTFNLGLFFAGEGEEGKGWSSSPSKAGLCNFSEHLSSLRSGQPDMLAFQQGHQKLWTSHSANIAWDYGGGDGKSPQL